MRYTLAEVEKVVLGTLRGPGDLVVHRACFDSRSVEPGDLFFALKGQRDGVEFVGEALAMGAVAAVVPVYYRGSAKPVILVEDTLAALKHLAFFHRNRLKSTVIAITGTVGKTTTKAMVSGILASRYTVSVSRASFNNHIGVPVSILQADHQDFLVLEIGTNHPGEIASLSGMARPHFACITSVGYGHTEALGDLKGVAREKASIIGAVASNGKVFLPEQLPHFEEFQNLLNQRPDIKTLRFKAENIRLMKNWEGVEFTFRGSDFFVPVANPGYAHDAACALAISLEMGIDPDAAREVLAGFQVQGMRMKLLRLRDITVLNDAYNSNPDSAMTLVGAIPEPENTLLVMGDMLELGHEAVPQHQKLGRAVKARNFKKVIWVGPLSKHAAAIEGGQWFPDVHAAIPAIKQGLWSEATLVLKASRLMGLEKIIEEIQGDQNGLSEVQSAV